jgi:spore coat polysaccharide biosynthesis predicted glycosyltransferase SpsG
MRSLALAQAWIDEGGTVRWLLAEAPAALAARLRSEGIELVPVAEPDRGSRDGGQLGAELDGDPGAVAVVDGYAFGTPFLAATGAAACRVLLVDDLAELPAYPVRWVLNQNAHASRDAYPADAPPRFLLGLRYLLLRREFRVPPAGGPVPPVARRLLATFGGLDPANLSTRVIAAVAALPADVADGLEVRLVVGAANPALAAIGAAARGRPAIDVRTAVEDMAAEIRWAHLAVTSGGTTVWELARYGCPAIVIETVPAEVRLASGLRALRLFDTLGHERMLDTASIAASIALRARDAAWRTGMQLRGTGLVDGGGAQRVVRELVAETERG